MAQVVQRRIFDGCALGLLLIAYLMVMRISTDPAPEMARYVPAEALIFAEQLDPLQAGRAMLDSPLGQALLHRESDERLGMLGVTDEALRLGTSVVRLLDRALAHPLLRDLDLGHFALALLPSPDNRPRPPLLDEAVFDNLVFWVRARNSLALAEVFNSSLQRPDGWKEKESSQYGRHRIRRIFTAGMMFSLVMLDDTLLLALNENHLRHCIDVFDGEHPSFADTSPYLWLPADGQQRQPLRRLVVDGTRMARWLGLDQSGEIHHAALSTIAYQEHFDQGTRHQHLHFAFRSPGEARVVGVVPVGVVPVVPSPEMMPRDHTMFWLWANSLPFATLVGASGETTDPSPYSDVQDAAEMLDQAFEELATLLNREILVIADTNPEDLPLAVPLILLGTTLDHPQKLLQRLEGLLRMFQVPVTSVDQESLRYWYWSQSPGEGLFPLFGSYGNIFFLGNSRDLVQQLYSDRDKAILPIWAQPLVDPAFVRHNNLLMAIDHRTTFATVKKLLQMLITLTAIKDRDLALQYGQVFDSLLGPLLEGWQEERRSLVRAELGQGNFEVEVITGSVNR